MKRLLHSHTALTVRRIALLYVVLALCRLIFWSYNRPLTGAVESWGGVLKGSLLFDTVSILYANALYIVLALLPLPLRLREHPRWQRMLYGLYVAVNSVLLVVLNLADTVYFRYTQKRFTADEIFFADNDNSPLLALKFAAENWYLVLAGIALIALLAWGAGRKARPRSPLRSAWSYYPAATAVLALAAGLSVGGIRGGFTRMTRPVTLSNATLYVPTSAQANGILSNPFCILRTAGSSGRIEVPDYFPPEEADRLFSPVHRPEAGAGGSLRGRNVVVFILESMSAEHSAHLYPELYADDETKGFTPFLDSLMRTGYCFRRMYANGLRSIQAMPAVLGSIPSFKTPFVLMPQSLGESRQLPRILRDKGYETAFFCGSESGSMGFGAYACSAGIERLYAREDYEARHGKGDFDGFWGIWDAPFLQFAGEELSALPEPFFATLFTLSAHHPFRVPEELAAELPAGHTAIHRCVAYDDRAFRDFFDRFGGEEWFRRTLFVFVADHVSSERYGAASGSWPGDHHIIGFLYAPDSGLQGESDEPAQQIDLMPTVLGLLGSEEPYFAFGRDLFGEPERAPWAVAYESGYEVVTEEGTARYPEEAIPDDPTGRRLKALIQQYYRHISEKRYVAD